MLLGNRTNIDYKMHSILLCRSESKARMRTWMNMWKKLKDDYDGLAKVHASHAFLISLKDTLGLSSVEVLSNYHIIKMLFSMHSLKVIAFIKANPGGKMGQ